MPLFFVPKVIGTIRHHPAWDQSQHRWAEFLKSPNRMLKNVQGQGGRVDKKGHESDSETGQGALLETPI